MHVPTEVSLFILSYKREMLAKIESEYELKVYLINDDTLIPPDYRMERIRTDGKTVEANAADVAASSLAANAQIPAPAAPKPSSDDDEQEGEDPSRKRRRRRGRRRGRRR